MHEPTAPLRDRQGGAVRASWTAVVWTAFRAELVAGLRPTPFVLGGLVGLLLAYLGPFESDRADVYQRYIYWPGVIVAGTLLGIVVSAGVDAVFDRDQRRPIMSAVLTAAIMTPPATLLVLAVTRAVFGVQLMPYLTLLGPVFLLSLAMTGLNLLANRPTPQPSAAPQPEPEVGVRFLDRLPPRLRGADLHAVEAEDHYLRVHTSRGSDLILLRLADAIAELEGLDGAQTHRSWWVAKAAVQDVRRGDGRAVLMLPAGVEAPVSRSFAPALRDRGWY
jgi:LytTr DNA-binding domain